MRRCPQRELQNPRHAHRLTAFRVTNGVTEARVVVRCRSTRPTEPIGVRESHSDIRNVVNDACSRHVIDDLGEHPGECERRLVLICDGRTASASTLMPDASTIEIGIVTGSFPSPTGLPSTNKFSVPGALALERPVLAGRGKLETQGIGDVPSGRHARRDAFAPRVRERAVQDILMRARTRQRSIGEHQSRPWLVRRTRPAGKRWMFQVLGRLRASPWPPRPPRPRTCSRRPPVRCGRRALVDSNRTTRHGANCAPTTDANVGDEVDHGVARPLGERRLQLVNDQVRLLRRPW